MTIKTTYSKIQPLRRPTVAAPPALHDLAPADPVRLVQPLVRLGVFVKDASMSLPALVVCTHLRSEQWNVSPLGISRFCGIATPTLRPSLEKRTHADEVVARC
ncbi:hypothetical protein [Saccharopolyspora sp. NPDC002578]